MAMIPTNFLPGDPRLIEHIVYELKSQGIFDQFRKECIADVDTKPAYQNLSQRVEGSVMSFLERKKFSNNINKNQLREQLRKHITESRFLESGVERIVDQVVNPKINSVFLPKVEDVVYKYLGIEKPQLPAEHEEKDVKPKVDEDLLNTDVNAVSSELLKSADGNSSQKTESVVEKNTGHSDDVKLEEDEDESPDFESLEEENPKTLEENSVDSTFSGFSSAVGNHQDISQNSMNSEENNYSTVNSEDDLKLMNTNNKEIISLSEKSNSSAEDKPDCVEIDNEENKKSATVIEEEAEKLEESRNEEHHDKSSKSEKSKYQDKDRRERRKSESSSSKDHRRDKSSSSKHSSSSSKDKRERINSSSRDEKSTRNDKKNKQSRERHRSRSEHEDKYSKEKSDNRKIKDHRDKSEKHRSKESRDKSGSSSRHHHNRDKESTVNKKSKEKLSSTSSSKYKSSTEAANSKKSEKEKSSSLHDDEKSTNNKDKKVNDDHYSFKDKHIDRRSTDRDSNDGSNSNRISRNNSFTDGKNTISDKESSENNFSGGGNSSTNNSDKPEEKTVLITHQNNNHVIKNDLFEQFHMNLHNNNKNPEVPAVVKCSKPKFAANIKEAMKIMKIRKQLAKLERDHQLTYLATEPVENNEKIEHDDDDRLSQQKTVSSDDSVKKICNGNNSAANFTFSNNDEPCYYLENLLISNYYLKKLNNYITSLEDSLNNRITLNNKTIKRKLLTEDHFESDDDGIPARKRRMLISYRKLNNGHSRTSSLFAQEEDCSLAENQKCIEIKQKDLSPPVKPKRIIKGASSKRYNTEDLYKPRPIINFTSSRRRNMNTSN